MRGVKFLSGTMCTSHKIAFPSQMSSRHSWLKKTVGVQAPVVLRTHRAPNKHSNDRARAWRKQCASKDSSAGSNVIIPTTKPDHQSSASSLFLGHLESSFVRLSIIFWTILRACINSYGAITAVLTPPLRRRGDFLDTDPGRGYTKSPQLTSSPILSTLFFLMKLAFLIGLLSELVDIVLAEKVG